MLRRNFLKVVGTTGAMIAISPSSISGKLYGSDGIVFQRFEKVQLLDRDGIPLNVDTLKKEINYVFNYPYASTPSILLDLTSPTNKDVKLTSLDGEEYIWKGGVGSKGTIVAYSAICAHQMAHPTPDHSFLQYCKKGQDTMAYKSEDGSKGGVMVCSTHLASYDVSSGCKVLGGPAEQPLASIIIEVAVDETLWATAVLGGDKFHEYFKVFKPELKKYYGGKRKGKKKVEGSAITVRMNEYTKEMIQY